MIDGVDCLKAERSVAAFADRIGQIISGRIDLGELGRRAQSVVWREFHISAAVGRVETILTRAAAEAHQPATHRSDFLSLARFAESLLQVLLDESTAS
jgi:hypothetical protein